MDIEVGIPDMDINNKNNKFDKFEKDLKSKIIKEIPQYAEGCLN